MRVFPSYEQPIYADDCYSDEISNRQRRSLRQRPQAIRLDEARQAQALAGFRIRISRNVLNQGDFSSELKLWIPFVQAGVASRRSLGNLAVTLFDTGQQPLRHSEGYESKEELEDRLRSKRPELFTVTPPIGVTGTRLFGNESQPFVGLTFEPGFIFDEVAAVRPIVGPELGLDSSHQRDHIPHVSLGQVWRPESVDVIQKAVEDARPSYVKFGPTIVSYEVVGQF